MVFSEYELREMGIKFTEDDTDYSNADCVGSCEEELEAITITKKCRGVVRKTRTKGTGNGTLKISMHCPWDIYTEMYGMNLNTLIDGVKAYGRNSVHKTFSITQHVFDEDEIEKFKAYPNCILKSGLARKIENGAEEVAEIEIEVSIMPDDYGNGMYEALASELKDTDAKTNWMTKFNPDMVQKVNG